MTKDTAKFVYKLRDSDLVVGSWTLYCSIAAVSCAEADLRAWVCLPNAPQCLHCKGTVTQS